MKKIMSLVLATAVLTSANAENLATKSWNNIKSAGTATKTHVSSNKGKYIAGTTSVALTAAALYDYYYNDAKVMNAAAKIATKYSVIGLNKTITNAEKLAVLVKENPVVAISAISGAAVLTGAGIYTTKDLAKGEESKIRTAGNKIIDAKDTVKDYSSKKLAAVKNFKLFKKDNREESDSE